MSFFGRKFWGARFWGKYWGAISGASVPLPDVLHTGTVSLVAARSTESLVAHRGTESLTPVWTTEAVVGD